jgi:hypothetical protein
VQKSSRLGTQFWEEPAHEGESHQKKRAQIHGRIKKGILDGYPSSALPWLPEDPSDILSIFPFLSDRVFEPFYDTLNMMNTFYDMRF